MSELVFSDYQILYVKGALNFDSIKALWDESRPYFKDLESLRVDLSDVTHCDSAGLALLIEWRRLAHKNHQVLRFEHLPKQLINIARVSNLLSILHPTETVSSAEILKEIEH
ncbi:MAG: STAS domain-containing protein [Pseudomonadota bacterium]|nr:STAS domain-containing protein [Gammaproteobacteria bacterium]MBU1558849.1 STAS domain-containing protein [Gammaproteobacteria bacterium]MBU1628707.1 STAS domain-containing protein [Gammaproteobacteria bacterium]MBU1926545.1 STAS domain-containing protein [Gammaproteobacteria bacterium]MBU2545689.1 STAS domain-containing protein [Gammaproteobacteria bacterium]